MEKRFVQPYGPARRAKAFTRGILSFSPLVEVAKEGLKGGYLLDYAEQEAYAARVAAGCTAAEICDLLEAGCRGPVQERLAEELGSRFFEGLRRISALSFVFWEIKSPYETFIGGCRPDAQELAVLRQRAGALLASGKVTSEDAQSVLVPLFRHYNILDRYFKETIPELSIHLSRLLGSESTSLRFRGELASSVRQSLSIGDNPGLPMTPYDSRPDGA